MNYLKGMKYLILLLLFMGMAYAARPDTYKSKAYNFGTAGVDAFEITLDGTNVMYIWREVNWELVEVGKVNNFCEPEKR